MARQATIEAYPFHGRRGAEDLPLDWSYPCRGGDLDILITTNLGLARLFHNNGGNGNHWLNLRLVGTRSNRSALGAVVRVESASGAQWRMVHSGSSSRSRGAES